MASEPEEMKKAMEKLRLLERERDRINYAKRQISEEKGKLESKFIGKREDERINKLNQELGAQENILRTQIEPEINYLREHLKEVTPRAVAEVPIAPPKTYEEVKRKWVMGRGEAQTTSENFWDRVKKVRERDERLKTERLAAEKKFPKFWEGADKWAKGEEGRRAIEESKPLSIDEQIKQTQLELEKKQLELANKQIEALSKGGQTSGGKPDDHQWREAEAKHRYEEAEKEKAATGERGGKSYLGRHGELTKAAGMRLGFNVIYVLAGSGAITAALMGIFGFGGLIGPLLNLGYNYIPVMNILPGWIVWGIVYLIVFAALIRIRSSSGVVMTSVLVTVAIFLASWLFNGLILPFIEPIVGPGLYCTLSMTNAQAGGNLPQQCLGQDKQPQAVKTASAVLLTLSFGQSGVSFPQPKQDMPYQFPITISNPSNFDIGPVVVGTAYMCNKTGGQSQCSLSGGFEPDPYYPMSPNTCNKKENNCIIAADGAPFVVTLSSKSPVPFQPSYVNLFTSISYPFNTSGTNDFYITRTNKDIPTKIEGCTNPLSTRSLGQPCTGAGPVDVVVHFDKNSFSLGSGEDENLTAIIDVVNKGKGSAIITFMGVSRFTNQNLAPVNLDYSEGNETIQLNGNCGLGGSKKYVGNEGENIIEKGGAPVEVVNGETATFICKYNITAKSIPGPNLGIKFQSVVNYEYVERGIKENLIVQPKPGYSG